MGEKLVRDRIEAIFAAHGQGRGTFRIAHPDERWELLLAKLREEVGEFEDEPSAEELADVLEVVYALAGEMTLTRGELEAVREMKARERGAFAAMAVWNDPIGDER
jgi:predicted house-cleaning noncanonical NTP pyrophosphatase (MazG superfamily)